MIIKSTLIVLVVLNVVLAGCCAPMECKPAKLGFRYYAPIIVALENYKLENDDYPSSLNELVPKHLAEIPVSPNPPWPGNAGYEKIKKTFTLAFRYSGPGQNICVYRSTEKKWSCLGYY